MHAAILSGLYTILFMDLLYNASNRVEPTNSLQSDKIIRLRCKQCAS